MRGHRKDYHMIDGSVSKHSRRVLLWKDLAWNFYNDKCSIWKWFQLHNNFSRVGSINYTWKAWLCMNPFCPRKSTGCICGPSSQHAVANVVEVYFICRLREPNNHCLIVYERFKKSAQLWKSTQLLITTCHPSLCVLPCWSLSATRNLVQILCNR